MQCLVYRSSIKPGLYVYVTAAEVLDNLPAAIVRQLGAPELALSFDLTPERRMGSEDPVRVLANLDAQGFHVQMPRDIEPLLERIARLN